MAIINVPYAKVLFTADGGLTGLLTVSSTNELVEKALVWIKSSTQPIKGLIIDQIISSTQVYVKEPIGYIYHRFNANAYLQLEGASLTQPKAQLADSSILSQLAIIDHGVPLGLATTLNLLGSVSVALVGNRANITIVGGGGGSYPLVDNYSDLPITIGIPPLDDIQVVRYGTGIWPFNRKERGLYIRTANAGAPSDWSRLGDWVEAFSDDNFGIYDNIDTTKRIRFDLGTISPSVTRLYVAPDQDGTLALLSDVKVVVKKAGATIGTRSAVNFIEGSGDILN
jgi:hypothetical protein